MMKTYLLYILLCIIAFSCNQPKEVVIEHRCNNDNIYCFVRCEMCNTIIEIDSGKIIKEHTEHKHPPVNRWMQ